MKFIQLFGLIAILVPLSLADSADDAAPAVPAISKECDNNLKIHRVHGNCDPKNSRGLRKSAHNCSGKNYFCFNTETERGTCMSIAAARKKGYEHGECFL